MIARIWHGITRASQADEYLAYLNKTGIPDYQHIQGNQGVIILRRIEGDRAHFLLISYWENEEAIRRYAGSEIDKARYYSEDKEYLLELEPNVTHYEVMAQS